jgi:hypothetical protein
MIKFESEEEDASGKLDVTNDPENRIASLRPLSFAVASCVKMVTATDGEETRLVIQSAIIISATNPHIIAKNGIARRSIRLL